MKRHLATTLFTLASLAATSQPASKPAATQPATIPQAKEIERAERAKEYAGTPRIGPFNVHDVLRLRVDHNRLVVSSPLESYDGQRVILFHHPDDAATIDFHAMSPSAAPDQPRTIYFKEYDFRDPKSVFVLTEVIANPGNLQVCGSWQFLGDDAMRTVGIIDTAEKLNDNGGTDDAQITLRVQGFDGDNHETHKIELSASDLKTLQRKHPAEVNAYLRPVLRALEAESLLDIDPMLAWQVLAADARPDPATVAKVNELLAQLDANNFADRERAVDALGKLGPSAAVALLQLDRAKLSPEQNSRVDEILTSYQQLKPDQAEHLARDPAFLLGVMDSNDAELRRVAAARLAKLTGHPLDFDPTAPVDIRLAATATLRQKLTPPPSTHAIEKGQ